MDTTENMSPVSNKLQAMIMGIGQGSAQNPMQAPPTSTQPGGFPRPVDPAARPFKLMIDGLKALAHIVTQLGDDKLGTKIEKMAVDLQHEFVQRTNAFTKQQEERSKLMGGQPNYSQVAQ